MTGIRLRSRAALVEVIEEGNAHHIFKEIDLNHDGWVSRKELRHFTESSGIDGEIFETAFNNLVASKPGEPGGEEECRMDDLVAEFTMLITKLKRDAQLEHAVRAAEEAQRLAEEEGQGDVMIGMSQLPDNATSDPNRINPLFVTSKEDPPAEGSVEEGDAVVIQLDGEWTQQQDELLQDAIACLPATMAASQR